MFSGGQLSGRLFGIFWAGSRFGIILYQGNDLVQSLTPRINSLFGYDEAVKNFKEFYTEKFSQEKKANKYTGTLEGMNVIFVHMESIQSFLLDLSFNGEDVLPTVKNVAHS